MLVATVELREPERSVPTAVPLDLRTALHRAARRLAHAADLAAICADGSEPEVGAQVVTSILASLGEEMAVFRETIAALPPE